MDKQIDEMVVNLPSMTRNLQLSDLVKKALFLRLNFSIMEL